MRTISKEEKEKIEKLRKMINKTYWGFRFAESTCYQEWFPLSFYKGEKEVDIAFLNMMQQHYRLN